LVKSRGQCKNINNCTFAHGEAELRVDGNRNQMNNTKKYENQSPMQPVPQSSNHEFENQILTKQLLLIIESLTTLYANDHEVMFRLEKAAKILQEGKINESAESLHVQLLDYS
jgi:hypothetical protein